MRNKNAKQMIKNLVGNGAEWLNNWNEGSATLIYLFKHDDAWYVHSYVSHGVVSLTADQLRGVNGK